MSTIRESAPSDLELAGQFPAVGREHWQRLVAGVLAKSGKQGLEGAAAEAALSTVLDDGLTVRPLYTADDAGPQPGPPGFAPYVRGARPQGAVLGGWDIRQCHADPDPRRANEAILADLENGVTSLWLEVGDRGLAIDALPAALDGVHLDLAAIVLDAGAAFPEAARGLFAVCQERGVPAAGLAGGTIGADPLGLLARTGDDSRTAELMRAAVELAGENAWERPGLRTLTVDALAYHDAGATVAQELGCALATAIAYLRGLTNTGLSVSEAAGQMEFRFAATTDQFLTIAKLRAARQLWSRVLQSCGAPEAAGDMRQHAVASPVMMTERDPWVNMLRTTIACLAGGVGGAQALTVLPFDAAVGLPDAFARRIARNTQSILIDESHLSRVIDPAGGSWYVETLTRDVARAAWSWFQEIERASGLHEALTSGLIAERIGAAWAQRAKDIAQRREPILGVSEFPNLGEEPLVRPPSPAPRGGGLPTVRRSEAFEELRNRSDAYFVANGSRPRMALIGLGTEAVHAARSSFAANLFQAGGIETVVVQVPISAGSGIDVEALAKSLNDSGAAVACLCSSDAIYADHAAPAAAVVREAGIGRVWLAGRPSTRDDAEAYRSAGIEEFVYVGCDVLAALRAVYAEIGVS